MNPKKHSFSRVNTFSSICERQAAFDALYPTPFGGPAAERGSHVHAALEAAAKLMVSGSSAAEALERVAEKPPKGILKENILAGYLMRTLPVFEHLKPRAGGVEIWLNSLRGREWSGKVDLISDWTPIFDGSGKPVSHTEDPCIIDYKTTNNPSKIKTEWEAQRSLQLQVYSLCTGIPRAGFLYLLPSGPVRGLVVEFSEEELNLRDKWLREQCKVINYRWEDAKRLVSTGQANAEHVHKGFDLSVFSLAAPDCGLCCEKWCDHWAKCLGKEQSNGDGS